MKPLVLEVRFDTVERARLAWGCQTLGITFPEFVRHATLQALDEIEAPGGVGRWRHA